MESNSTLITLVSEASAIQQVLLETGGEITPEIEQRIQATEINLPAKVDSYALLIERMQHDAEFYGLQATRLLKMVRAMESVVTRCKQNIKLAMDELKTTELVGHEMKFKLVKSPPSVIIEDSAKIPAAYKVTETTTRDDKKMISEDLKMGVTVPGARLESGTSLRTYLNTPKGRKNEH